MIRYKTSSQPVILNLSAQLARPIEPANLLQLERIDYSDSIDYSHLDVLITSLVSNLQPGNTLDSLASSIADIILNTYLAVSCLHVKLEAPRLLIQADSSWVEINRSRNEILNDNTDTFSFRIPVTTIVGCSPKERHQPQRLVITITIPVKTRLSLDYREICDRVIAYTVESRFKTVEALSFSLARVLIVECGQDSSVVKIDKLNCMNFARAFSYTISRTKLDFPGER